MNINLKKGVQYGLAVASILSVGVAAALPAFGSSHREAPLIAGDPKADATDLYALSPRISQTQSL